MRNAARSPGLNRGRALKELKAKGGRRDSSGETEADPLAILVVPHSVVQWHLKRSLLVKRFFHHISKRQQEKGKFAIFMGKTRLHALFDDLASAHAEIYRIVGEKKKCWENKRAFKVKQL